jgi:uncharacterized protein YbcI
VDPQDLTGDLVSHLLLRRRFSGKGPTKAKTHLLNDTVVCILRGGFTTVERTLVDTGEVESVIRCGAAFSRPWRRSSGA